MPAPDKAIKVVGADQSYTTTTNPSGNWKLKGLASDYGCRSHSATPITRSITRSVSDAAGQSRQVHRADADLRGAGKADFDWATTRLTVP